jgi:glycosyltransferase involved in cell wall biosynthesis
MKIALLGSRGIPARYSGVETCVENLATRLVQRGHEVTVYCRPHVVTWPAPEYCGVRLIKLPTIRTKFLDTFAHTALCTLHTVVRSRPDVAVYFIAGNSPFVGLARLAGIPTVLNVDGLDSERAKWGPRARLYLRLAEWLSARLPHRTVTDSRVVQRLYATRFRRLSTYIPYGAELPAPTGADYLARYGLQRCGYILMVGRLVPENGAHVLLEAYAHLGTQMPLVIVGGAPYADEYVAALRARADPRVIFTGWLFGEGYRQLLHHAYLFVLASGVGGTHPVLTEAMAAGNCIVANNHAPNREVLGDAGLSYDARAGAADLARVMQQALDDPGRAATLRERARWRAQALYSWDSVTDAYERLCTELWRPPSAATRASRRGLRGLRN